MVDLIIINGELKCVSQTIWKMLETEGGIPIPECMREHKENTDNKPIKMSMEEYKNGGVKKEEMSLHIDRVRRLIVRESKDLPEGERVVAVKAVSVYIGKIISNSDIINI